jgi:Fic family protein
MKITLDVTGTTGSAIATALAVRKEQLEAELAEINANLDQLKKMADIEPVETKHGETDKAVRDFMIQNGRYSVSVEEIVDALGISTATVYRALKKLKAEKAIVQLVDKDWMLNAGVFAPEQIIP